MQYICSFLEHAEQEFIESYEWYEQQQAGLGEKFAGAVQTRLKQIADNPTFYTTKKRGYREVIIDNTFPFVIVYYVDETNRQIIVVSIFHTGRSPKNKYRK